MRRFRNKKAGIALRAGLIACAVFMASALGTAAIGSEIEETEAAAAVSGAEAAVSETESDFPVDQDVADQVNQALAAMDQSEVAEYAKLIESVLRNPDFQDLLKYEEVRDLLMTLLKNVLSFSEEDPELTAKILETLGVDERAVYVFYEILQTYGENKETIDSIASYLETDEGKQLTNAILENFDQEEINQMLDDFNQMMAQQNAAE